MLQLFDGTSLLAEGLSRAGGRVTLEEPHQKPAGPNRKLKETDNRRMASLNEEAAVSSQGKGFLEFRLLEQWSITYCTPLSKV